MWLALREEAGEVFDHKKTRRNGRNERVVGSSTLWYNEINRQDPLLNNDKYYRIASTLLQKWLFTSLNNIAFLSN